MKNEKLNFEFPIVKNMEETKLKHAAKVKRLRSLLIDNGLQFTNSGINNGPGLDDTIYSMLYNGHNTYYVNSIQRGTQKQNLRALKKVVNEAMRNNIQWFIEMNDLPKSYDTAVYIIWEKSINKLMKGATKRMFKNFGKLEAK
jgi:CRISPR/Cas system CMR-associated protein Cmr5 small subunit